MAPGLIHSGKKLFWQWQSQQKIFSEGKLAALDLILIPICWGACVRALFLLSSSIREERRLTSLKKRGGSASSGSHFTPHVTVPKVPQAQKSWGSLYCIHVFCTFSGSPFNYFFQRPWFAGWRYSRKEFPNLGTVLESWSGCWRGLPLPAA